MPHHWVDPVVEEVRERGRRFTARFGNDIHRIVEELRRREREHPERCVHQITIVPGKQKKSE